MFDYHSLGPSIGELEIVMERQFNAHRTLMFQVFTQPEHLKRWWAPQPYTLPICTIDLRPGGIWHYCMHSPEGRDAARDDPHLGLPGRVCARVERFSALTPLWPASVPGVCETQSVMFDKLSARGKECYEKRSFNWRYAEDRSYGTLSGNRGRRHGSPVTCQLARLEPRI